MDPAEFEILGQETVFRFSGPFYREGSQIPRLNATAQDCKISISSHHKGTHEVKHVAEYDYVSKQYKMCRRQLTDGKLETVVTLL